MIARCLAFDKYHRYFEGVLMYVSDVFLIVTCKGIWEIQDQYRYVFEYFDSTMWVKYLRYSSI